jgi:Secretory lipase
MGIEGYSQGGGAAGWAAQLQPRYAPGLRLRGVAMGGTPANLQAVAANINGSAFFAFLGGSVIGFNAAYPSLGHVSDLTPAGRAALAQLDTMCQEQALVTYAGKRIQVAARYFGEWVAPRIFDGELEEERLRRRY